jgi:calcyphosin
MQDYRISTDQGEI